MADTDGTTIVELGVADARAGLALSTEAHWNQNEADWRFFLTQGIVFGVHHRAKLVATAALLPYSSGNAWISMVLVTAEWRRRGIATRLVDACLDAAAKRSLTAWLDATPAGANVYGPLGFTPTLQLRAGHFAGQSSLEVERWSSSASGPFFYEPTRDTLLAVSGDHLVTLSTVVLYEHAQRSGGTLSIGPMHSLMRVHSGDLNQVQRAGVVMIQQRPGRHMGLSNPRATVMVARYLDDPTKRGQWSAAVAVGFDLRRR